MKNVKINVNMIDDFESLSDVEQYIKSDLNRVYNVVEIDADGDYPVKLEGFRQGFNALELIVVK